MDNAILPYTECKYFTVPFIDLPIQGLECTMVQIGNIESFE